MAKKPNITELLAQRRIWAVIVGVTAWSVPTLGLDVPVLTDLLTNVGTETGGLIAAVLALWSYFQPKK